MWDMLFVEYMTQNWQRAIVLAESLHIHYRGKSKFNTCQLAIIAAHASMKLGNTAQCRKYLCEIEPLMAQKDIRDKLKRRELWETYKDLLDGGAFTGDCK